MKKIALALGIILGIGIVAVGALATLHEPRVPAGVTFMGESLEGLTRSDARRRLENWWSEAGSRELALSAEELKQAPQGLSLADLGIRFDVEGTMGHVSLDSFPESVGRSAGWVENPQVSIEPVLGVDPNELEGVRATVQELVYERQPPKVNFEGGRVVVTPERAPAELDEGGLLAMAEQALSEGFAAELPLAQAEKSIPDEEIARITGVMGEFVTHFSAADRNRSSNIRVAAASLDGAILKPGDKLSYNETVGQRTTARGYKRAGIYVNGRHDFAIGGGICQVSTTLYNAALLSGIKIVERRCHSMPVPYVNVGLDATVDWGSIDLVIENNTEHPIAVDSEYQPGKLTFRILGRPVPGREVKIERQILSSWTPPVKVVEDPSVPVGHELVVDKGGRGYKVATQRVVYEDGKKVSTEDLGISHYPGGSRIIAVNPLPVEEGGNSEPPVERPAGDGPDFPSRVPPIGSGASVDGDN